MADRGVLIELPGGVVRLEQRGGNLGVAEDGGPLNEGEICGNDDSGALIDPADDVEEQLAAGPGEGQIPKLVEDGEVDPCQMIGDAALLARVTLGVELIDQIADFVEAPAPQLGAIAETLGRRMLGDQPRLSVTGIGSSLHRSKPERRESGR